jgi:hypothetical protein
MPSVPTSSRSRSEIWHVVYYWAVQFASTAAVQSWFCYMRTNTCFHDDKADVVPRLSDEKLVVVLAFLSDIEIYLDEVNVKLRGKIKLLCDTCSDLTSFKAKLILLHKYIMEHNRSKCLNCNTCFESSTSSCCWHTVTETTIGVSQHSPGKCFSRFDFMHKKAK